MEKRIFIIDDDYDILEPMELLLEGEGYVVQTMQKIDTDYKKIEEFKPDVILLDMLLSGSDGRTICKDLKNNSKLKHIPIILMSAHPGVAKDAKIYGADAFIAKPFEITDLIKIVKDTL